MVGWTDLLLWWGDWIQLEDGEGTSGDSLPNFNHLGIPGVLLELPPVVLLFVVPLDEEAGSSKDGGGGRSVALLRISGSNGGLAVWPNVYND